MLKLFEVTGFKNFKNKITLDFSDVRDYKFNANCVKDHLVSKMIVYGKNSIGKSNLGLAIFDIVSHLSAKNVTYGLYDYFLNVESPDDYAVFHYVFSFGGDEIDYTYRKDEKQTLLFEQLYLNRKLLFDYDYRKEKGNVSGIRELAPTLNLSMQNMKAIFMPALKEPHNLS